MKVQTLEEVLEESKESFHRRFKKEEWMSDRQYATQEAYYTLGWLKASYKLIAYTLISEQQSKLINKK